MKDLIKQYLDQGISRRQFMAGLSAIGLSSVSARSVAQSLTPFAAPSGTAATREAMFSTLSISVMVLAILAASQAFTQLLAYTGSAQKLVQVAGALPFSPIWVLIATSSSAMDRRSA